MSPASTYHAFPFSVAKEKPINRQVFASVADIPGLSHTVVERMFKKVLGSTIQREIMKARVDEAQHLLLTTELPANEVGVRCGFKSSQYFSRNFAAFTGCPPQAFRERKGK